MAKSNQETKQQEPATTEQAVPQFVAERETMTLLGVTFGEVLDAIREEQISNGATINALNETISDKNSAIDLLTAEVAELKAKFVAPAPDQRSLGAPNTGLQRLPNGGMRFTIDLDRDESLPLLDQAEGACEDPVDYLRKTLKEALLVYTS
jgi:hypothetical protein